MKYAVRKKVLYVIYCGKSSRRFWITCNGVYVLLMNCQLNWCIRKKIVVFCGPKKGSRISSPSTHFSFIWLAFSIFVSCKEQSPIFLHIRFIDLKCILLILKSLCRSGCGLKNESFLCTFWSCIARFYKSSIQHDFIRSILHSLVAKSKSNPSSFSDFVNCVIWIVCSRKQII